MVELDETGFNGLQGQGPQRQLVRDKNEQTTPVERSAPGQVRLKP